MFGPPPGFQQVEVRNERGHVLPMELWPAMIVLRGPVTRWQTIIGVRVLGHRFRAWFDCLAGQSRLRGEPVAKVSLDLLRVEPIVVPFRREVGGGG